ncbi:unnamed protein product [Hydatigera taeniaeformis]|uniref:Secreted protein n=1 Tax=Hydatigena taeniaeformis TaxID=6205 RepID=A0A0R3WU18_HYDTA|nr:unnamed protein product [Hydatigera taeniaeformis]
MILRLVLIYRNRWQGSTVSSTSCSLKSWMLHFLDTLLLLLKMWMLCCKISIKNRSPDRWFCRGIQFRFQSSMSTVEEKADESNKEHNKEDCQWNDDGWLAEKTSSTKTSASTFPRLNSTNSSRPKISKMWCLSSRILSHDVILVV